MRRALRGRLDVGAALPAGDALVERHHDVDAERLHARPRPRVRKMAGAVEVRAERHALLVDLAQRREAEDLVAAAVGEDRRRPSP